MTGTNPPQPPPQMPPARVVFESVHNGLNVDTTARCALVVFPDPSKPGMYNLHEQHGDVRELAQMCEIVLRFGIANGLAGHIFAGLFASPTQASAVTRTVTPVQPPVPGDDLPPPRRG